MDTLVRFGTYNFIPKRQISIRDNFRDVVPRTTRLPGLSGGFDEFGDGVAPSEIGNVQVVFWMFAGTEADMENQKQAVGALADLGVEQLYKQPVEAAAAERWCEARINSIDYTESAPEQPFRRLRVTINFQVANPVWLDNGTEPASAVANAVSGGPGGTVVIDNAGTVDGQLGDISNFDYRLAQSFQPTAGQLSQIKVNFGANTNTPTGDVTWRVHSDSSGVPGTVLDSGTFTPTPSAQNTINVTDGPFLLASTTYWLSFEAEIQTNNNKYNILANDTDPYADGRLKIDRTSTGSFPGTWDYLALTNYDLRCEVTTSEYAISDFTVTVARGNIRTAPRIEVVCGASESIVGIAIQRLVSSVVVDEVEYHASLLANDTLEIDCREKSVTLNGADAYGNAFDFLTAAWFQLAVGDNDIRVILDSGNDACTVKFYYYEVYK